MIAGSLYLCVCVCVCVSSNTRQEQALRRRNGRWRHSCTTYLQLENAAGAEVQRTHVAALRLPNR